MAIDSFDFLVFMPIVFVIYWFLCSKNRNWQNGLLVLASYFFYAWWDWRFAILLFIITLSSFLSGILLSKSANPKRRRLIPLFTIILHLGILFYFKYFNFFVQGFVDAFSLFDKELSISTLKVILPIGISFFTFTSLSYTIDVYKNKVDITKDFLAYFAYISFFPSLFSGPISRATLQLPQYYTKRVFNYELAANGFKLILWGLFMKTCIANQLGMYVDAVYGNIQQHNGTTLSMAAVLYSIQIYCDFGGYSLIAIGAGKLLGINLVNNFVRPYFSRTITDFWRRWHISLTSWFRDYIYIPLGGNRVQKARMMLNIMIVFVLSGIWHGAAYTFVLWGALHGLVMIFEKKLYGNKLKNGFSKNVPLYVIQCVFTFIIITIAWILFRANNISDATQIIGKIFTNFGSLYTDSSVFLIGGLSLAILILKEIIDEFKINIKFMNSKYPAVRYASVVFLISYILLFGVLGSGEFIYFQF